VLGADERILERELELFERLRLDVAAEARRIQATARALATLDVLGALAEAAAVNNYIKPQVRRRRDERARTRHPVVERRTTADAFVPDDITLNAGPCQLVILTGPNMGGKSTYLRQTALLCVMGSRARSCRRARQIRWSTGSSRGSAPRTTSRAATRPSWWRCRNGQHPAPPPPAAWSCSTDRRRGAATFDGLSLAWAIASSSRPTPGAAQTLFATHYHELTDLADAAERGRFHVSAREWKDDHLPAQDRGTLRSQLRDSGRAAGGRRERDRARARDPRRARTDATRGGQPSVSGTPSDPQRQLGLFQAPAAIGCARRSPGSTSIMTPIEAFTLLAELKNSL
jgi:DNA mismatch repair protein MutS